MYEILGPNGSGKSTTLEIVLNVVNKLLENTAGLVTLWKPIKQIAAKATTILLASHLLDEVEKVYTHVVVLRKGEILYTGLVDGMSANEGFVELQADDIEHLIVVVKTHPAVKNVGKEDGKVLVYLKDSLEAKELNRFLSKKNVVLHYLVKRKNSLEEQILKMAK